MFCLLLPLCKGLRISKFSCYCSLGGTWKLLAINFWMNFDQDPEFYSARDEFQLLKFHNENIFENVFHLSFIKNDLVDQTQIPTRLRTILFPICRVNWFCICEFSSMVSKIWEHITHFGSVVCENFHELHEWISTMIFLNKHAIHNWYCSLMTYIAFQTLKI